MTATLREARPEDLGALYRLEQVVFSGDRFNRRQLWHLLNRAHAQTLVAEEKQCLIGYGTLLFRQCSRRARLYSLGVDPAARGGGLGRALVAALEEVALACGTTELVLEVRVDNRIALGLYRSMGFRLERWLDDYYTDGCAGWQMRKPLSSVTHSGAPS